MEIQRMTQNSSNGVVRIFSARACAAPLVVRIFSARACAAPLEKAAKLFEQQSGIHVQIDVCSRHCAEPVAEVSIYSTTER